MNRNAIKHVVEDAIRDSISQSMIEDAVLDAIANMAFRDAISEAMDEILSVGGTIAHAREIYANASEEYIEAVITVYKNQNSAAFYED